MTKQNYTGNLQKQFVRLRWFYFLHLMVAAAILILYFIDQRWTLVALGCSLFYHLAIVRPASKTYEREYIHACIQSTLERYLSQSLHTREPVLAANELRAVRLIPDNGGKGSVLCREGGYGMAQEYKVRLGDVTFAHSFPMDGKTHHQFITGCWVCVHLGRDTGLDWRLVDKRAIMQPSWNAMLRREKSLKEADAQSPCWWLESHRAFYAEGTPQPPQQPFMEALRHLCKNTSLPVAACVKEDMLHVFLVNRLLGQRVSMKVRPQPALIERDYLPELGDILKLAATL